jgi:hypothetical protein
VSEHQKKWTAFAAKLVYPTDPPRAAAALLVFLPLFKLPDDSFTVASAEAVAMGPRRLAIPSFDEVAVPLFAWWRDHRPDRHAIQAASSPYPALPGPVLPDRPTDEAKAAVAAVVAAFVAEVRAKDTYRRPEVKPAYLTGDALARLRAEYRARVQ